MCGCTSRFMMCDKLLIFQKMYDLTLWLYPLVNRIPKSHRMVLGKAIEELAIGMVVATTKANSLKGKQRVELQQLISSDLDTLRILLRLTKDLKFMSIKQYAYGSQKINEVARMLHSWMKV